MMRPCSVFAGTPYHAEVETILALRKGCTLVNARRDVGTALRHLFTVRRNNHTWTLCGVLVHTGIWSSGVEYGVLFQDNLLERVVDYRTVCRMMYVYEPEFRDLEWNVNDFQYVDRAIGLKSVDRSSVLERVAVARKNDGIRFRGDYALTFLIMPFAIIETPLVWKYRYEHSKAEQHLSGFNHAIGEPVAEVKARMGDPDKVRVFNGNEAWLYEHRKGRGRLRTFESARMLVLIINNQKVVAIYNEDGYSLGFISPSWIR